MTTPIFPAPGRIYEANFGELAFQLKFDIDGKTMRFVPASAPDFDKAQAVTYRALAVRPGVFLVTWVEADGTTVTHVEDFEEGLVHTNITQPNLNFLNLTGSWKQIA
ncbi:hypothetical protein FYK61_10810 [Xanthomonas citri]|uniref:MoaF-related domain-containing protein n=1 Tax=Xanthomonas citri TaxID=346 RepID=UPI00188515DC|nr:hypothetical protein [Xanthomonas citri]QOY21854.1 hypothetical protein FYK61_10810 [Xanthomonas citri]QQK67997.1 hypothetical protein G3566_10790 [Xanthomonas citri]